MITRDFHTEDMMPKRAPTPRRDIHIVLTGPRAAELDELTRELRWTARTVMEEALAKFYQSRPRLSFEEDGVGEHA